MECTRAILDSLSLILDWLEDNWLRAVIAVIILGLIKGLILG